MHHAPSEKLSPVLGAFCFAHSFFVVESAMDFRARESKKILFRAMNVTFRVD